jgi:UDP-N-acetylglucosamine 2-epimerase (non-hydrolysing)
MKILTIAGTRPELIRLSEILHKLDKADVEHVFVWTGQNYTRGLKDVFFEQMGIRAPDYENPGGWDGLASQLGDTFKLVERAIREEKPDKALILGDTNSALAAIICERMGVPVYHLEAGNRCFDKEVPEEINRRLIDHTASYALTYTPGATRNLMDEGISRERIFEVGNPIWEVMGQWMPWPLKGGYERGGNFVATFHRQENVDRPQRLRGILEGLLQCAINHNTSVQCSVHPRTRARIEELGFYHDRLVYLDPMGFEKFLMLESRAALIFTDSGTVQEEACILKVPCVTLRRSTERPETIECGSNMLSGTDPKRIERACNLMLGSKPDWWIPAGYQEPFVSDKVLEILGVQG